MEIVQVTRIRDWDGMDKRFGKDDMGEMERREEGEEKRSHGGRVNCVRKCGTRESCRGETCGEQTITGKRSAGIRAEHRDEQQNMHPLEPLATAVAPSAVNGPLDGGPLAGPPDGPTDGPLTGEADTA